MKQTMRINGVDYKYELRLVNDQWKPVRLEGYHVPPGDTIFSTYEQAREEARKRNRRG